MAFLWSFMNPASACDVCGCGIGGYYLGILPQYQKHLVGIRYRQQQFRSYFGQGLFGEEQNGYASETFRTTELWGRFYPHPRVQVVAFVPLQHLTRENNGVNETLSGMGDITLLALYEVARTNQPQNALQHKLLAGGGFKLPTGKSSYSVDGESNPNFQLGTGSWDVSFQAVYILRYRMMGLNTDVSYRMNGTNENDYRFGDRYNFSVTAFHVFESGKIAFMPAVGIASEWAKKDASGEFYRSQTGGKATLSHVGLDVYRQQWNLGFSWQHPIRQNLADELLSVNERFQVQLNFLF